MCALMCFSGLFLPRQVYLNAQTQTLCQQLDLPGTTYYEIGSAVNKPRASGLPSTAFQPGQRIHIKGNFEVDVFTSFNGCVVKMDPNASVYTSSGGDLSITNGSKFFSCGAMWKGIAILSGSAFVSGSQFEDAEVCFKTQTQAVGSTFINNVFNRNHVGIWLQQPTIKAGGGIYGNTFSFTSALLSPYAGQTPLCGIRVSNGTVARIGQATQNFNTFQGLLCGIATENSTLRVVNSRFQNMVRQTTDLFNLPGFRGGAGILSMNSTTEVNLKNSLNRCVFTDNASAGIFATRSNLQVAKCDFSLNASGIESRNNLTGYILDVQYCNFTELGAGHHTGNVARGIFYDRSAEHTRALIAQNNFETATQNFTDNIIWAIDISGTGSSALIQRTGYNTFVSHAPRTVTFIKVEAGPADQYDIINNHATFYTTLSSNLTRYGILMSSGTGVGHYIKSNVISGEGEDISGRNYLCGMHIQSCPNIHICNNQVGSGYRGFHFLGNSNREEFIQNIIGGHTLGLQFSTDAQIGIQERAGNRWTTTSYPLGGWAAMSLNPLYETSRFLAHSDAVEFFLTDVIRNPVQLFGLQLGNAKFCIEDVFPPDLTDFDQAVADGSQLSASDLEDWENKRQVYYKLLRFPAFAQASTSVAAFYAQMNTTSAGRYAQADYRYWQAAFPPANLTQPLTQLQAAFTAKSDSLYTLDSLWNASPQDTVLYNQVSSLTWSLSTLSGQQAQVRALVQLWINTSLDSMTATLSGLPQTTAYEQARAEYLAMAAKKMRGDAYSVADLALLSGLVQSGEVAIGLTAADALRLLPPDDSLHTVQQYPACGAGTGQKIYSGAVLLPADQISLRAYPNPADDIVQFLASGFGEGAELVVYSTLGLRVAAMPVGSGRSFEININKLQPGAYVCVLQDAAGRTARQRLVISR